MPAQKPGRSKQDYSTPAEFIAAVEKRYGKLDFDLAAYDDGTNAKAPVWFGPSQDSLKQDWRELEYKNLWLNPPFGDIEPWVAKCAASVAGDYYFRRILLLVPASVGSNWFANYVHNVADVNFLKGRLSFDGKAPFPKDCMLCEYGAPSSGFCVWDWKKGTLAI